MTRWTVEQAKGQLSDVMDRAQTDGPQFLTRDGADVAVVLSMEEYQRLIEPKRTLADLLFSGPKFDDFELPPRQVDLPRDVNIDDDGDGVAAQ